SHAGDDLGRPDRGSAALGATRARYGVRRVTMRAPRNRRRRACPRKVFQGTDGCNMAAINGGNRMLFDQNLTRRAAAALLCGAIPAGAAASPAAAQNFPERTITLIVPFAAGGASDVSSRIMAEAMAKILGQSVVVENVAGAGGGTGGLRGKNA